MAVKLKILKFGDLTSSPGGSTNQLDSAAGTKAWLIRNIYFYNRGGSAILLDLYVNQGIGANVYLYKTHSIDPSGELLVDREITLNHNGTVDKVTARCTNGSSLPLECVV